MNHVGIIASAANIGAGFSGGGDWILAAGAWDDTGLWNDSSVWID